ncbi:hypothetical protein [Saccharothrix syringae]|uniref:Uncharacterized protein n=1 Tax=Saccharothrix syringae TaxID=103733 RepID=A0A5Q0GUT6_SACSY|nr:hypothetical protein [Saccharothrix syringae]QFZ17264.1 hypothetical protein EKG83_07095 [Saccharothrix syringae]
MIWSKRCERVGEVLFTGPMPGVVHQKALLRLAIRLDAVCPEGVCPEGVCPEGVEVLVGPLAVVTEVTEPHPDVLVARREDLAAAALPGTWATRP